LKNNQKIYFASDFHLGMDAKTTSEEREQCIVRWLDMIQEDAAEIYMLGDIFDYWFEYKMVIPKGYPRLFGKLRALRDANIPIYFFTGNHDMWMFDYFEKEFDIPIYRKPITKNFNDKIFFLGHGDGLGPGDHGYKFIKKVFANKFCQWLFARIHPNLGMGIMEYWSRKSRLGNKEAKHFLGGEKEWLAIYANKKLDTDDIDYFIFGHRHLPIDYTLKNNKSRYINLGEWMHYNSYAVFDGNELKIKFFENEAGQIANS